MAHKTFDFTVDFNNRKRLAVANVKQNDSAVFNILLVEDGKPVDLTNQQIRLFINKPDDKLVVQNDNITVVDAKRGSIRINVKNSAFQAVGTAVAELDVWGTNQENASSQNFFIEVDEQLGSNDAVKSYVDVNLFRQLTEYIDTANANIAKYRAVMEAFTKAGISAQGLLDIKAYIDNNLAGLKAQGDRADNLIVQLNSKNSLADNLIKSLNNTISSGENKKQELINTTKQAEAKKQEVISVTNQAEAKKQDVINYTNKAEAKRAELANATATAEAKRVEVVNATNTGNSTKTALDKATATAEAKRVEVVNATNTANTKIPALEKIIAEADTQGIMLKGTVPASRDCNDFKDFNRWIAWDTGAGDFKNTPWGTLAMGTAQVFYVVNRGFTKGRTQQEFVMVYPQDRVTRYVRNYNSDNGGQWGTWWKVYDEANKPTPEELGALGQYSSRLETPDFNELTKGGTYATVKNSIEKNAPVLGDGRLLVVPWSAMNFCSQMFFHDSNRIFVRVAQNNEGTAWTNWAEIYSKQAKPSPEELGALNANGGNLHGNLYFDSGKILVTANNYGIKGFLANGSASDYMLYMGADNRIKISFNNRPVDVQAHDVSLGNFKLAERDFTIYGKRALVGMNSNDGNKLYINYCADFANVDIGGNVTIAGVPVATDIQKNPLWTGCYYVTDTQTVTPSKPLSKCRGGWMLVWSDFNGKLNDTNCVYTYIPKYGYIPFPNETDMLIPISAFDAPIVKALRIADTYFTGYGTNADGNKGNVALRAVYEY